ncbi:MAG: hypothetical protein WCI12_09580, partial [Actinomycetes bacterium]
MRRRPSEVVEAIAAAGILLTVPMVLLVATGSPLPGGAQRFTGVASIAIVLCWLAWAWCTLGVLVSVVRRVCSGESGLDASRHGFDALAARLAAIVLSLGSLLGTG